MSSELLLAARKILNDKAVRRFEEPIQLASGKMSTTFIDGKAGLAEAGDLRIACQAMVEQVTAAGITFAAAGGLTLGADHLAVGVAMVSDRQWFIVRKEPKNRGTGQQVEGASIEGVDVFVVEDVVSTGGSLFKAIDIIQAAGANVVAASTLIDRGEYARAEMETRGVPYFPLATYADLGLDSV